MPVSTHLVKKLREVLGADAAEDLVSLIEGSESLRGDVAELRHEMQLGFARIDAKFEKFEGLLASGRAELIGLFEKGLREQTRFFFLAWSVILAAIVGLYAR